MSKKTSRIVKLILILLIGIIAVYNAIKPGDNSSSTQYTLGTSQIEQTSGGVEQQLPTETSATELSTTTEKITTTEKLTTEPSTTTEAPTTEPPTTTVKEPPTTEPPTTTVKETTTPEPTTVRIKENGTYTSKEDVAEYLHLYGHLPSNYITKDEAKDLGWVSNKGNLWDVAPGKSIGGDYFGNFEGLLPKKNGRKYYECDIDFEGSYRGSKRIIFSNDGLIYYTDDHYESFECLYGK